MKSASLHEIKKEISLLEQSRIRELCMRLAKYKKDNKELLSYLLFDSGNEAFYIEQVKEEMDAEFMNISTAGLYFIKKNLRKILRNLTKKIRFSGLKQTEIDLLIYFCLKVKNSGIPVRQSTALENLYLAQLKKIKKGIASLHEDLQYDYQEEFEKISEV